MWTLAITEKEMDSIYGDINIDKERFRVPVEGIMDEEVVRLSQSKLWRLNNWYTIIDKDGVLIPFRMNRAQHVAYASQLIHPRDIFLKSRQRGISTFFLINYFDDAITLPNITVGMQSYGLEESTALLEKLTVAWERLNDGIKNELLRISLVKNNTKAMSFSNGSQVKVATSFRGTTLHRLHVSELGKIANKDPKKAKELKTGTLQALKVGNPAAIESTAEGQHNAFHDWWYTAIDMEELGVLSLKDFKPIFLSWVDDPDCTMFTPQQLTSEDEEAIIKIETEWAEYIGEPGFKLIKEQRWWFSASRRELGDEFYQEYPHTPEAAFAAVKDGSYYARVWRAEGHVWNSEDVKKYGRNRLYDPALPVVVSWDLGVNDVMVLIFSQILGKEIRVIDEYHNSGEGLEHYVEVLERKGYSYSEHVLPHDANVFEMGAAMTRKSRLYELGLRKLRVLRRTRDINTDIEQVRKAIKHMYIDPVTASYVLKMMMRYSKKWDDINGTFMPKPLHNEWSNPADALRYLVMARLHTTSSASSATSVPSRRRSNVVDGMAL